jgi:hypothetical protein
LNLSELLASYSFTLIITGFLEALQKRIWGRSQPEKDQSAGDVPEALELGG